MIRHVTLLALLLALPSTAPAQFAVGGVFVDPEGVVRQATREAVANPLPVPGANDDVARPSDRRIVSLDRLERALADAADRTPELEVLAGLTRIDVVYLLEDDVLLAGPAEGWRTLPNGIVVGARTGRPVLRLEDLAVALRMAFDEGPRSSSFGCSIDPTAEGAARMAAVTQRIGPGTNVLQIAKAMEQAMGPQAVRVFGVENDSPFALGLIAADVRLKQIAMGFVPTGVRAVPSYVDMVAKSGARGQIQNRFWFVAHFDEIRASPDRRAFELDGPGIKLLGSPPVTLGGPTGGVADARTPAGRFAAAFNEHTDDLAEAHPELGALQNQVTLAVAAELVVRPHLAAGTTEAPEFWWPDVLVDEERLPIRTTRAPKFVPSVAGVQRTRRGQPMIHVSGGVQISPSAVARSTKQAVVRGTAVPTRPEDAGTWWWDAKPVQSRPKASSSAR